MLTIACSLEDSVTGRATWNVIFVWQWIKEMEVEVATDVPR